MRCLLLLACLWFGGCAHFAVPPTLDDFQAALAQHDFVRARHLTERLQTTNPEALDLDRIQQQLDNAEQQFVTQSIRQAGQLDKQRNLQEAIDLLTENSEKLSKPYDQLNKTLTALVQKQIKGINQQFNRILVSEATWMLEQKSDIRQLGQQQQNDSARRRAAELNQRQPILAQQLADMGQYFANETQWYTSDRSLTLAQQLGAELPDGLHDSVKQHLQRFRQHRQQQQNQQYQQEADRRIAKYNSSQQLSDLLAARDYIETNKNTGTLTKQETQITLLSRKRFEKDMKLGDSFYTSGNYVSAQRIWKRIAPLYPDHPELSKKLERVEQVRQSLHSLKSD